MTTPTPPAPAWLTEALREVEETISHSRAFNELHTELGAQSFRAEAVYRAMLTHGELFYHSWDGHNDTRVTEDDTYGLWIPLDADTPPIQDNNLGPTNPEATEPDPGGTRDQRAGEVLGEAPAAASGPGRTNPTSEHWTIQIPPLRMLGERDQ